MILSQVAPGECRIFGKGKTQLESPVKREVRFVNPAVQEVAAALPVGGNKVKVVSGQIDPFGETRGSESNNCPGNIAVLEDRLPAGCFCQERYLFIVYSAEVCCELQR